MCTGVACGPHTATGGVLDVDTRLDRIQDRKALWFRMLQYVKLNITTLRRNSWRCSTLSRSVGCGVSGRWRLGLDPDRGRRRLPGSGLLALLGRRSTTARLRNLGVHLIHVLKARDGACKAVLLHRVAFTPELDSQTHQQFIVLSGARISEFIGRKFGSQEH